jgi:thioredoxin 1
MRHITLLLVTLLLSGTAVSQASFDKSNARSTVNKSPLLSPSEFQAAIAKGDAILVDVRTPQEYGSGHIPGSINLDWTAPDYEEKFASLDRGRPVLVYCAIGGRSDQARAYLYEKGYQVLELEDGIVSWKKAGLPLERK